MFVFLNTISSIIFACKWWACYLTIVFWKTNKIFYRLHQNVNVNTNKVLHYSTSPLLHYTTTPLFHYSTILLLHYSTTQLLHYSTTPLLHYSTIPLFHYSTTPLLHYSKTPKLHYSTIPLNPILKFFFRKGLELYTQSTILSWAMENNLLVLIPMTYFHSSEKLLILTFSMKLFCRHVHSQPQPKQREECHSSPL